MRLIAAVRLSPAIPEAAVCSLPTVIARSLQAPNPTVTAAARAPSSLETTDAIERSPFEVHSNREAGDAASPSLFGSRNDKQQEHLGQIYRRRVDRAWFAHPAALTGFDPDDARAPRDLPCAALR